MKQQLSVPMLAARATFYKILGALALMGVVEGALFHLGLSRSSGLESAFDNGFIPLIFRCSFIAIFILLISWNKDTNIRYTIRRLAVSERAFTLWNALYGILIFFILWGVQLGFALLLCKYYLLSADPASINQQTVFLAFYRSDFLHSLLPLAEVSRWVRQFAFVITLGVCSACAPCLSRRNYKPFAALLPYILFLALFDRPVGDVALDAILTLGLLTITTYALWCCWGEATDDEA